MDSLANFMMQNALHDDIGYVFDPFLTDMAVLRFGLSYLCLTLRNIPFDHI